MNTNRCMVVVWVNVADVVVHGFVHGCCLCRCVGVHFLVID